MVNPYDRFIENSTIDYKKCTIACYVDNDRILHIDEHMNKRIIEAIEEHFWRNHRIKRKKSQVSGNGHIYFRKQESIFFHRGLHRGTHHTIWKISG